MKKGSIAGIALGMFAIAAAGMFTPAAHAADTAAAKKALMDAVDNCEMKQKTDAREVLHGPSLGGLQESHHEVIRRQPDTR